ncbi:unnamed protein product [Pleuronectes platessa]|uniref:Uncharacterized protein n=1 Tax=Pleuronectes platessa TaxID=8262 RepID=A0A9N7TT19_PLEPL|nr:unnamed protein product [Pleuronectes platessa]
MSRASRLARPPSTGAGSKLPSPRKECHGTGAAAGRVRVLSVGEKLMRAGSDGILNRQKSLMVAGPQDKAHTQAPNQRPGEKGENMEMLPPRSRISPPKASAQQQGSNHTQLLRNCEGDAGNRAESSEGVTEGGQECERGMLGNQQVRELCLCLTPSPQ